jgi:hypothetical protein
MLPRKDKPCGNLVAHSAGTLMYWPKPPETGHRDFVANRKHSGRRVHHDAGGIDAGRMRIFPGHTLVAGRG